MTLDKYIVKHFFPVLFIALSMFVVLVLLIDLFANLVNYLNHEAAFSQIMNVSYFYIPKAVSYSLPISLLFAVAYTLGDLYAKNELTSVISSGIPFWRFGTPLMIIGVLMSVFSFYFDDKLVIPTLRIKNELSRQLKQQINASNNANVVIKTNDGRRIYSVDYYDYQNKTLNGVIIVELDAKRDFLSEIRAHSGVWTDNRWVFANPVIYQWEAGIISVKPLSQSAVYDDDPELFRRIAVDPADLPAADAKFLVEDLRKVGLPYLSALADYYHRYSFPATSFIVVILSLSMGGRFRKNILLMSLLASLVVSVVYYVMDMITMMLARLGYLPPLVGAWIPVVFFTVTGAVLIRFSKT